MMAKAYNTPPSEILGIDNKISAYYVDNGFYLFGQFVEGKLNEAEARVRKAHKKGAEPFVNNVRKTTFNALMGIKDDTSGFRSPSFFDSMNSEAKMNSDKNTIDLGDDFFG